jgi:hypothetical protein
MASKHFLRTIVTPFQTITASAAQTPIDLPVNPISCLLLTTRFTQVTETASQLYSSIFDFLNLWTSIQVQSRGQNIISGNGQDIMALVMRLSGMRPGFTRATTTAAAVRSVTLPLMFSRRYLWPNEGIPASQRGNLKILLTAGALPATASAMSFQIESIEMPDSTPTQYVKYVTQSLALTATGQFDAPLPIGNPYAGILLFEPNILGTTARQYSWGQTKLLVDNTEQYYPLSDWETLAAMFNQNPTAIVESFQHSHLENAAAAYAQFAQTDDPQFTHDFAPDQYGYMDFDPLQDGTYLLETAGHADVKLRGFADASAPNATVRYLPIELVGVRG